MLHDGLTRHKPVLARLLEYVYRPRSTSLMAQRHIGPDASFPGNRTD